MSKRNGMTFLAAAILAAGTVAFGHDGIEHIRGTVKAVTPASVTVETPKHTSVTILIDSSTTYSNNNAKAALHDLKPGERVLINAKEGPDEKLHGVSVNWGAPAAAHDHGESK